MKSISRLTLEEIFFLPFKIRFPLILITHLIIILFFGNFFDFFDNTQRHDLNKQLLTLSSEFTKMHLAISKLRSLKVNNGDDKNTPSSAKLSQKNLSYVFKQLTMLAQQNYTEIYAVKPLPKQTTYGLTTQPITITLASDYDRFLQFLKNLKRLPIVFTIRDLTIQPNHHSDQESNSLNFNLILDIYTNESHH